jgi:transcription elongation factor Elf1
MTYQRSKKRFNERGLMLDYCPACGAQLSNLVDVRATCQGYDYDCRRCGGKCSGLRNARESGHYIREVRGTCKACDARVAVYG